LVRVLVAERHALARYGYRALLESEEQITVVGEAATAAETIKIAAETRPGVLVLDLDLPGLDEPARTVSHPASAGVAVMVIASSEGDERVFSALRAGAVGALTNDAEPAEVIRGIYALARGEALISAAELRRLLREPPRPWLHHTPAPEQPLELTDRERAVVALVGTGLTNAEIAETLVISPATAKTHVSRAMVKLGVHHRAQLVVIAYETGLVQPGLRAPLRGNGQGAMGTPPQRTEVSYFQSQPWTSGRPQFGQMDSESTATSGPRIASIHE
jgi:DNA-binding NarL/FixJ family response regulator